MNSITEKIWYTDDENKNMRLIISTLSEHPAVWRVTKCENIQPFGIQKITIYSDMYNPNTDYVNFETGEMYADFYESSIEPVDPSEPILIPSPHHAKITASTFTIKVGGSYKVLTASVFDDYDVDITDEYLDADFKWICKIGDNDCTDNAELITWLNGNTFNKKKIKFSNEKSYLNKILEVTCLITKENKTIEAIAEFELTNS